MPDRQRASADPGRSSSAASADALATTVQRLGDELAGLHRARRSRSVIEQAKGVLMARLHCSAEQAFDQLVQISQQTNTKVAEVAAGFLGLTSPVMTDHESPATVPLTTDRDERWNDWPAPQPPLPDQDAARYYLACAAMSAARDGDAIAEALLTDGLQQLGVTTVLLAVLESDGAIRLAGSHGLPRGVVSAWQRVSASLNVGYLRAAADGRVLWLNRAEAMSSGLELLGEGEFRACLPLRRGARVFGVASFIWAKEPDLDLTRRAYVMALGEAAGRRLAQLITDDKGTVASPSAHWLEAVLQAMPESLALLCPITDDWGTVVDWRFDKCSPDASDAAGRTREQLLGRRLLELNPHLVGSEILRGYEGVLHTGRPFSYSSAEQLLSIPRTDAAPLVVHAAKFGEGILVAWQPDPERQLLSRIQRLEHAVGAGWLEWDLQRGETTSAAATSAILGVRQAPAEPADLHRCVRGEDAPTVDAAVQQVMGDGRLADVTVRLRGSNPPPRVRMVIEPISDGRGRIIAVSAAVHVCAGPADSDRPGGPEHSHLLGDSYPSVAPPRAEGLAAHEGSAVSAEAQLSGTIRRLRNELADLRLAQRAQAMIDQATGVLAVQLVCSMGEAADHLIRIARRRRSRIIEVAAEIVGVPAPDLPTEAGSATVVFEPERYVGRPPTTDADSAEIVAPAPAEDCRLPRVRAAIEAAEDGDALARIVWAEALRDLGATTVLLGVLEPDGAVRLVGTYGLPGSLVSAWRRTPSWVNVAYLRAVATGTPLWITRGEAEERGYQLLGEGELRACLPLHEAGRIFGVASVLWEKDADLDPDTRTYVAALADLCGHRLSRLIHAGPQGRALASPAAHWAETIMAALPACYAILRPQRDLAGEVRDWRFEACSPESTDVVGRTPDEIVGRRLRDLYPHVDYSGVFDTYTAAMHSGATTTWGPGEIDVNTASGPITVTMTVRACRFGDGVLVHWRQHDRQLRLTKRLALLERVADCGWAEWNLASGEAVWSAAVYEILQRDPRKGPVKLGALHRYVRPQDEMVISEAVHAVSRRGQPVDCEVTLRRHGHTSRIRFVAEPAIDRRGRVTAVHTVFQRLPAP